MFLCPLRRLSGKLSIHLSARNNRNLIRVTGIHPHASFRNVNKSVMWMTMLRRIPDAFMIKGQLLYSSRDSRNKASQPFWCPQVCFGIFAERQTVSKFVVSEVETVLCRHLKFPKSAVSFTFSITLY